MTARAPLPRPSSWFAWHAHLLRSGVRVLDVAVGDGRHSLAAAALGAEVVAVDADPAIIALGRAQAELAGVSVAWQLRDPGADLGQFDVVLALGYPDRHRVARLVELLAPGGTVLVEAFLDRQSGFGWGPSSSTQLFHEGELAEVIQPLTILFGREVVEPVDGERWRAVASIVARSGARGV